MARGARRVLIPLLLLGAAGAAVWHFRDQLPWDRLSGDKEEPAPTPPPAKKGKKKPSSAALKGTAGMDPDQARLAPPAPKACLAGPSEADLPEDGMVAGKGLDEAMLRAAMAEAAPYALPCFADAPSGAMTLEIVAGCDGRVRELRISDDGGYPSDVTGCVAEVLRNASLPAHDLPDGQEFRYPLRYEAP